MKTRSERRLYRRARVAAAAALAIVAAGCAAGGRPDSGFLHDYSRLQPTVEMPQVRIYRDVDEQTPRYDKILFRPVQVWRGEDRKLEEISDDDLQYLADALHRAVSLALSPTFELVEEPGPGVLEIHLGMTHVPDPDSSIDFFSTAVPVTDLEPHTGPIPDATRRFVHAAAVEAEFLDAETGHTRAALVDMRTGPDAPKSRVETWDDLDAVFARWGALLEERIRAVKTGTFQPRLRVRGRRGAAG